MIMDESKNDPENRGLKAFEDPEHPGNGPEHRTGEPCATPGCYRPAGTAWSPYWCFECNVERIRRIAGQLDEAVERLKAREGT